VVTTTEAIRNNTAARAGNLITNTGYRPAATGCMMYLHQTADSIPSPCRLAHTMYGFQPP
jgi:hypothetical protein